MTTALRGGNVIEYLTDRDCVESIGSTTGRERTSLSEGKRQVRIRYPGGGGSVTVDRDPPRWFFPAVSALGEFFALPENWDTYGAPPIDGAYFPAVLGLMSDVMKEGTPLPSFVPTSRGGVQLEWHTRGIDLEVAFLTPSRIQTVYDDLESGETWEKDLSYDLGPLTRAIERLSKGPRR